MKIRLFRWMSMLALLAGAILFYLSGMMLGVVALIVVGGVLELMFWSQLLIGDRKPR